MIMCITHAYWLLTILWRTMFKRNVTAGQVSLGAATCCDSNLFASVHARSRATDFSHNLRRSFVSRFLTNGESQNLTAPITLPHYKGARSCRHASLGLHLLLLLLFEPFSSFFLSLSRIKRRIQSGASVHQNLGHCLRPNSMKPLWVETDHNSDGCDYCDDCCSNNTTSS